MEFDTKNLKKYRISYKKKKKTIKTFNFKYIFK